MWSNQLERICFVLGLLFTIHSISQEVVVQPYLQKLTDQGVVVLWETNEANSWYLDWGPDQQQIQSVVSQSNSLLILPSLCKFLIISISKEEEVSRWTFSLRAALTTCEK